MKIWIHLPLVMNNSLNMVIGLKEDNQRQLQNSLSTWKKFGE